MPQARKQLVYLCGPIAACTDAECSDWRTLAHQVLDLRGHAVLDPLADDYRGREESHWQELVEKDLAMIRQCDAVLANLWKPSPGSSMELVYARLQGKSIYAAVPAAAHPWVRYHATLLFPSIDEALEATANLCDIRNFYDADFGTLRPRAESAARPAGTITAKMYPLITRCLEDGAACGWNHAHKHTDHPTEHELQTQIVEAQLLSLSDALDFGDGN